MNIKAFNNILPQLGNNVFIDDSAVVIGQVVLGDESSVWPNSVIRGDINTIKIGRYTNIQDNSVLHVNHASKYAPNGSALKVGNYVTVGHRVILHGCQIDDYCLIGMGAIVMDDAHLPQNTYLAAGSIVPSGKMLEGGYLWMGTPAKRIRPLTESELEFIRYSAEHYAKLKDQY